MRVSAVKYENIERNNLIEIFASTVTFQGIQKNGNDKMYAEVEKRFTFYMRIIRRATCVLSSVGLYPFVPVAYDWCMGKYVSESWIFHLKLW